MLHYAYGAVKKSMEAWDLKQRKKRKQNMEARERDDDNSKKKENIILTL
jgi:hypothetical protein